MVQGVTMMKIFSVTSRFFYHNVDDDVVFKPLFFSNPILASAFAAVTSLLRRSALCSALGVFFHQFDFNNADTFFSMFAVESFL